MNERKPVSKGRFYGGIAVVVIALTLLNTYFILRGKHENTERSRETSTLALANHKLAVANTKLALANCHNLGTLASVERAFIARQESQTQALLKSGVTFGIPAEQLPRLIAASKASSAKFLGDLDALTTTSCAAPGAGTVPVVKPHRKAHRKVRRHATSSIPTTTAAAVVGAVKATGPAPRRASPRTLPVSRPTRTVTSTTVVTSTSTTTAAAPPPTSSPPPATSQSPPPSLPARPTPEGRPILPPTPCVRVAAVVVC